MKQRCVWALGPYNEAYHDNEWGKPQHNDQKLFEMLILEGMQAGLSWVTILKKRQAFCEAFDDFDVDKVAQYDDDKIAELLQNKGIIRNRLKINAAVKNARAFQQIQKEYGSFDRYLWHFTDGKQVVSAYTKQSEVPTHNELSDRISEDLKKRGFSFVGTTIIFSYLEAVGVINDHMVWCDEYQRSMMPQE